MTTHPDRFDAIVARVADIRKRCPEAWITLKPLRVGFGSELYDYSPRQLEQLARGVPRKKAPPQTLPRGTMTR